MQSSFKIGRLFGVDIGVHWSWIFIFVIVTWSFATRVLKEFYPEWSDAGRWVAGAIVAVIFFLSILAHELSHAIVSNRSGLPVRSITLFVFGGVANLTQEPQSPGVEFKIAIVGPLTSVAAAGLFAAIWGIALPFNEGVAGVSANLAVINLSIAVFNMLPGFPLDGGRVFRSAIWARKRSRLQATKVAAQAGEWIAYGIMALGLFYAVFLSAFSGLWFLFIGFFLRNAAAASYQQLIMETALSGVEVRDVMQSPIDTVDPTVTVQQLVDDYMLRRNARCFAVVAAGELAGLITLTDIRRLPQERWSETTVYRAMTPASRLLTVAPSDSVEQALRLLAAHDVNQLPVLEGRTLAGIVTRADIMRTLQMRTELRE